MKEQKYTERYQTLCEMATIGRVEDLVIKVYTDHAPEHFHVEKKDHYEVRIETKTLKVLSYKWQKDGAEFKQWLKDTKRTDMRIVGSYTERDLFNNDTISGFDNNAIYVRLSQATSPYRSLVKSYTRFDNGEPVGIKE